MQGKLGKRFQHQGEARCMEDRPACKGDSAGTGGCGWERTWKAGAVPSCCSLGHGLGPCGSFTATVCLKEAPFNGAKWGQPLWCLPEMLSIPTTRQDTPSLQRGLGRRARLEMSQDCKGGLAGVGAMVGLEVAGSREARAGPARGGTCRENAKTVPFFQS